MTPWERLADAIIIQAAEDYRQSLLGNKIAHEVPCMKTLEECERFFRSEWYHLLTNVPGETIMSKIKGEVHESFANSSNPRANRKYFKNRVNLLRQ